MAMIKCRECGKEISSRAEACPHCGAKTRFGMNENDKKQASVAAVILILVSVVGTIIFFSALMTMLRDINNYDNPWVSGYNYKSPLTEHEVGVIMRLVFGGALDIGCSIGAFQLYKKK